MQHSLSTVLSVVVASPSRHICIWGPVHGQHRPCSVCTLLVSQTLSCAELTALCCHRSFILPTYASLDASSCLPSPDVLTKC